jgi:hypothetical protein
VLWATYLQVGVEAGGDGREVFRQFCCRLRHKVGAQAIPSARVANQLHATQYVLWATFVEGRHGKMLGIIHDMVRAREVVCVIAQLYWFGTVARCYNMRCGTVVITTCQKEIR